MKMNYKKAILLFFLIMSAMFLVIATTSRSCSKDSDDDGKTTTCDTTEGYKIVFADDSYEKAFDVGGKDGDLDRTINVKFDQLTRANGFGAAMPEFKVQYPTMDAANADSGAKVKADDGIIGLWGDYADDLEEFIIYLNLTTRGSLSDGSGPAVAEADADGRVGKPNQGPYGNAAMTSGPAWLLGVAGDDFVDYDGATKVGGAFRNAEPAVGVGAGGVPLLAWNYDNIGRLEDLPASITAVDVREARTTVFGTTVAWKLSDDNKGQALAGDDYDPRKGWQKLFSIVPCDQAVKNGLIAAQVIKTGAADEVIDAKNSMVIKAATAAAGNDVVVAMSNNAVAEAKTIFIDSYIGAPASAFNSTGFATMNYTGSIWFANGIAAANFHLATQLALLCRTSITGIDAAQVPLFAADDVKANKFTGGAEKLDCYLGISNLYPEWYEAIVQRVGKANTIDPIFPAGGLGHFSNGTFDTETKTVGLVIADTGDVELGSAESKDLFYTPVDAAPAVAGGMTPQQGKWKSFIEQKGVKTTYGKLKFEFVKPDIK